MNRDDAPRANRGEWVRPVVVTVALILITAIAYRDVLAVEDTLYFRDHRTVWRVRWAAVVDSFRAGSWPALTRAHPGGLPLESLLNGTYSPGLLLLLLGAPRFDVAYDLFVAFHTFVLAAGTYAFARALSLDATRAMLVSIVCAFAGPAISLENLLVILIGLAYAPWTYLALLRCLERPTLDRIVWLALATCFHLQGITPITLLLDIAVAAWILVRLRTPPTARTGLALAGAGLLAMGLGAVQLGPFIEGMANTARGDGFPYAERAFWAMKPVELTEFFAPVLLHPRDRPYLDFGLHGTKGYAYLVSFYLGTALPLALGGLAGMPRGRRAVWIVVLALLVVLAMGPLTPLHRWLTALPVLENSRYPSKFVLLSVPIVAGLAGLGLRHLVERRRAPLVIAGIQAVALVAAWSFLRSDELADLIAPHLGRTEAIIGVPPDIYPELMRDHLAAQVLQAAVFCWLLVGAGAAALGFRLDLGFVVVAIVGLDMGWAAGDAIVGANVEPRSVPDAVAEVIASDRERYVPTGRPPPTEPGFDDTHFGDIDRQHRLRGGGAGVGRVAGDVAWEGTPHPASKAAFELVGRSRREVALDVLRRAGVRWVLRPHPSGLEPPVASEIAYAIPGSAPHYLTTLAGLPPYVAAYTKWRIVDADRVSWSSLGTIFTETSSRGEAILLRSSKRPEPTPAPPAEVCTATAAVTIVEAETSEAVITADVDTPCPALVVAMEVQVPAWRARVDGEPTEISHAEAGYLATRVEPGRHRVCFAFEARTPRYATLSGASLVLAASLVLLGRARWRRAQAAVEPSRAP